MQKVQIWNTENAVLMMEEVLMREVYRGARIIELYSHPA